MHFEQIYQGWKNLTFPPEKMREFLKQLKEERLAICSTCEFGEKEITLTSRCKNCGCFLKAKASCTDCSCPLGKWWAVATPEEDAELQQLNINNE